MNFRESRKRSFLFLQGPHGSFFKDLSAFFAGKGYCCYSICFNGGDVVDKLFSSNTYHFGGLKENFPLFLSKILDRCSITDIFLYGDKRFYHTIAINIARDRGIKVWVYEEGYLRPGYVTLEVNGVNGNSKIPALYADWLYRKNNNIRIDDAINNDVDKQRTLSSKIKSSFEPLSDGEFCLQDVVVPNPLKTRVAKAVKNYIGLFFLYPFFPFYQWHRDKKFLSEIFGWLQRKLLDFRVATADRELLSQIQDLKYFAFPLQLSSDAQIKCASSFRDVIESVEQVMLSFKTYAASDVHLVVKLHPMDNSFFSYRNFVHNYAHCLNIADRVHFLVNANSDEFIENSAGVVVINSTMGILALKHLKPVITLGNAIYAEEGLATQAIAKGVFAREFLDSFWQNPSIPNRESVLQYFKILRGNALVQGNFYTKAGIAQVIMETADRIGIKGIRFCRILSKGIRKIPNLEVFLEDISENSVIGWGHKKSALKAQRYAQKHKLPYIALEEGFIKSITVKFSHLSMSGFFDDLQETWEQEVNADQEYNGGKDRELLLSLIRDRIGIYYDATCPSELENIVREIVYASDSTLKLYQEKGRGLINLILGNNISKYNQSFSEQYSGADSICNGDIFSKFACDNSERRVLVVDQTYGDTSVTLGNASSETFSLMLQDAVKTYGSSRVYVKIHPEVVKGNRKGFFKLSTLKRMKVNIIASDVNTIKLLKCFNDVYVVTSGTGFEALMCGLNVTCFGEPFYSGYGLTRDRQNSVSLRRRDSLKDHHLDLELLREASPSATLR